MVSNTYGLPQRDMMKALLEAGVHFGHQTKRWNPKMKQYIFTDRNGIHVIDLNQTVPLAEVELLHLRIPALRLVSEVNARLEQILQRDAVQNTSLIKLSAISSQLSAMLSAMC